MTPPLDGQGLRPWTLSFIPPEELRLPGYAYDGAQTSPVSSAGPSRENTPRGPNRNLFFGDAAHAGGPAGAARGDPASAVSFTAHLAGLRKANEARADALHSSMKRSNTLQSLQDLAAKEAEAAASFKDVQLTPPQQRDALRPQKSSSLGAASTSGRPGFYSGSTGERPAPALGPARPSASLPAISCAHKPTVNHPSPAQHLPSQASPLSPARASADRTASTPFRVQACTPGRRTCPSGARRTKSRRSIRRASAPGPARRRSGATRRAAARDACHAPKAATARGPLKSAAASTVIISDVIDGDERPAPIPASQADAVAHHHAIRPRSPGPSGRTLRRRRSRSRPRLRSLTPPPAPVGSTPLPAVLRTSRRAACAAAAASRSAASASTRRAPRCTAPRTTPAARRGSRPALHPCTRPPPPASLSLAPLSPSFYRARS